MADNYLEKKMEQHRARTAALAVAKKKQTISSLLGQSVVSGLFDGFVVRDNQLVRIAASAAQVVVPFPFRFKFFTGDDAVAMRSCDKEIIKATAYIAICPADEQAPDLFLLGRVVQTMLLQAAEMGLCASFVPQDCVAGILPRSLVVFALGRNGEPRLALDGDDVVDINNLIIE